MSNHAKGPMGLTYSQPIRFDAQGVGIVERTVPSIGVQVEIRGWLSGDESAVYDILLESPVRCEWRGIHNEEEIEKLVPLQWGSTLIKATIVSNKPGTTAEFWLSA